MILHKKVLGVVQHIPMAHDLYGYAFHSKPLISVQNINTGVGDDEEGYLEPIPKLIEEEDYLNVSAKFPDYESAYKLSSSARISIHSDKNCIRASLECKAGENSNSNETGLENSNFGKQRYYFSINSVLSCVWTK